MAIDLLQAKEYGLVISDWNVEPLLAMRRTAKEQFSKLDKIMVQLAKEDEVCRLLMTMSGVGPQISLAYKAAIDDPYRFRKSRNVGVHVGLTPTKYASGEVDFDGHITRCGDKALRTLLFEGAQVLLMRTQKWSALRAWGMQVAKRSSLNKAAVAVARKMLVILHQMWINGTEFRYGKEPTVEAAA